MIQMPFNDVIWTGKGYTASETDLLLINEMEKKAAVLPI